MFLLTVQRFETVLKRFINAFVKLSCLVLYACVSIQNYMQRDGANDEYMQIICKPATGNCTN